MSHNFLPKFHGIRIGDLSLCVIHGLVAHTTDFEIMFLSQCYDAHLEESVFFITYNRAQVTIFFFL